MKKEKFILGMLMGFNDLLKAGITPEHFERWVKSKKFKPATALIWSHRIKLCIESWKSK